MTFLAGKVLSQKPTVTLEDRSSIPTRRDQNSRGRGFAPGGVRGMGGEGEGIEKCDLLVINEVPVCAVRHRAQSITWVTDGYWTCHGDHFVRHVNVKARCCTPETNIMWYVN